MRVKRRACGMITFSVVAMLLAVSASHAQTTGITNDSILIGNLNPLSGSASASGISQREGTQLAVDEINAAGGVHGRKLVVTYADDECNPVRGLAAAKKMISDGAFILTGLYCSVVAATLLPEVERARVPLVLSGTLTARTVDPLNRYVFRVVGFPNSRDIAFGRASYWIDKLKATRIAFFHQADELGRSDIESTRMALAKYSGWEILALPINVGDTDFTAQILKAREWKPDLVYMNALPKEGSLLVKQAKELGLRGEYWGGGSLTTGGFYDAVGELATGMLIEISFSDEIDAHTPGIKTLHDKLVARFGKGPGRPNVKALSGYYSFKVLAEGLKRAGRELTREKLIAAMETMSGVDVGLGYPVTLSPTNHEGTNTLTIYKVVSATKRVKAVDITWPRQ